MKLSEEGALRCGGSLLLVIILTVSGGCAPVTPALASGVAVPRTVYRVEPEYPPALRQQRVEGVVEIEATIPKEGGHFRDIRVVRSDDPQLTPLVLNAVSQWLWKAGMSDGEPVDVPFTIRFEFPPR